MATFKLHLYYKKDRGWRYKITHPQQLRVRLSQKNAHFDSINKLYTTLVEKIGISEKDVHLHAYHRYRNRKIEIYHNWNHEWISTAQNHEKAQQILNGNWQSLEDAFSAAKSWIDEDSKLTKPRMIARLKEFPNQAIEFICYVLFMIPIISGAVVVYWVFNKDARNNSLQKHKKLTYGIYISAFITLVFILSIGIKPFLFFIPARWGGFNEDGDWTSTRETVSYLLAFFATCFIAKLLSDHDEHSDKIKYLEEREKNG